MLPEPGEDRIIRAEPNGHQCCARSVFPYLREPLFRRRRRRGGRERISERMVEGKESPPSSRQE